MDKLRYFKTKNWTFLQEYVKIKGTKQKQENGNEFTERPDDAL